MAFTYDNTTDRGRVRLLIRDTNVATAALQVFDDSEVDAFLALNVGVKRAAAAALMVLAADELQISKIITTQDLKTDAAKYADAMRALAAELRAEADRDADDDLGVTDVLDFDRFAGLRFPGELASGC